MADSTLRKLLIHTGGPTPPKRHPGGSKFMCKICISDNKSSTNTSTRSIHCMVTRGISTSISRDNVFNTPELLENILLQLDAKEIIPVRNVNKSWNALIMTSPRVQRKLFLLAEPESTFWICDSTTGRVVQNKNVPFKTLADNTWTIPATLNCMLLTRTPTWASTSVQKRMKICEPMTLVARPNLAKTPSIYHKMLLSQPPAKEIQFEVYYDKSRKVGKRSSHDRGEATVLVNAKNSTGVTFGDVLRQLHSVVRSNGIENPATGCFIRVTSSALWMGGVVLTTDEDIKDVEKAGN